MDFEDIFGELLTKFRRVHDAHQEGTHRRNGISFADQAPAFLFFDPSRVGTRADDVPILIRKRVAQRAAHKFIRASRPSVDGLAALDGWMKKEFRDEGWTVLILPVVDTSALPRGRRQLDEVEQRVREALDYLGCAFIPAMEVLCPDKEFAGEGEYVSAYEYMARNFHHLRAWNGGRDHVPAERDTRDNPALRQKFAQLSEDGQRIRWSVHSGEGFTSMTGANLRRRMTNRARAIIRPAHGPIPDRISIIRELHSYAFILNVLAKAQASGTSVFSRRPDHVRDYDHNVMKIKDANPIHVASNPERYGKRQFGYAMNAVNASRPEEFVQPPTMSRDLRFEPKELALLAFVADVDPYVICTQHQLFWPEVWAARELGAKVFERRNVQEADVEAIVAPLRDSVPVAGESTIDDMTSTIRRAVDLFADL